MWVFLGASVNRQVPAGASQPGDIISTSRAALSQTPDGVYASGGSTAGGGVGEPTRGAVQGGGAGGTGTVNNVAADLTYCQGEAV